MFTTIGQRQNEARSLRLLVAMRYYYSRAKRIRMLRVSVTVGVAALGPLLGWYPEVQPYLALLAWWTVLDQVGAVAAEEEAVLKAASIQEEFDTYVLGIPWNPRILPVPPEDVIAGDVRFRGNRASLVDWYGPAVPEANGALLCMRTNMTWDAKLRRTYGWILAGISLLWVLSVVAFSLMKGSTVGQMLLPLVPSLPLVVQNATTAKLHFRLANLKEALGSEMLKTWRQTIQGQTPVPESTIRGLQDGIYAQRAVNALVPDLVYRHLRTQYNDYMIGATQQFADEVTRST